MLRVLTYHRIARAEDTPHLDPLLVSATPAVFRSQMEHLRRRYRPVAMSDIIAAFSGGPTLPRRAVHVTVDDAYRDFRDTAWPILRELDIPVTLFVPTGYPDDPGRAFWWDRLHRARSQRTNGNRHEPVACGAPTDRAFPPPLSDDQPDMRDRLRRLPHEEAERLVELACRGAGGHADAASRGAAVLDWDELRELGRQGVAFGAHTRHHVSLTSVSEERVRTEIRESLGDLERELGRVSRTLAYPYGLCNEVVARIAREEGSALAFTCQDGLNEPGRTDPFWLRRTNITTRTSAPVFKVRMLPWFATVDRWRHRRSPSLPS